MKKILIIDDEKFMRRTIVSALRQEGFETLETENGVEGLQIARSRLPDLILCDVKMDKMDGYATLTALRDDPATAAIPFILMTAMAERNGMRQGMLLGADDYLPKPFSVDDLVATVNARLVKQKAMQRQADQKLAGFCSNISFCLPHALLTPLNGIMGFSELLRTDAASLSVEDTVEMADTINLSARDLHRVIQSYLIFAQAELVSVDEQKIATLRSKRTVLTRMMLGALAAGAARSAQRVQDITVDATESRVMISEEYFRKIVLELLTNALRFSVAGTPVRLATKVDSDGFVLTITDRGAGMTPEQMALVCPAVKFEQHMISGEGAGLGLVLARRLAELHGGSLNIQSEVDQGTTVEVRLPAVGA
jgi:two-component system, sensor histidine kinase and response regulator